VYASVCATARTYPCVCTRGCSGCEARVNLPFSLLHIPATPVGLIGQWECKSKEAVGAAGAL